MGPIARLDIGTPPNGITHLVVSPTTNAAGNPTARPSPVDGTKAIGRAIIKAWTGIAASQPATVKSVIQVKPAAK